MLFRSFNINTNKSEGDEDKLLNALYQDLRGSNQYIQNRKFSSVYFGGGTPSLVSAKMIKKILKNNELIYFPYNTKLTENLEDYAKELDLFINNLKLK